MSLIPIAPFLRDEVGREIGAVFEAFVFKPEFRFQPVSVSGSGKPLNYASR
jgi:hypothetical protein